MGRYGNTHNHHNFQDMDYRGYGQEDEVTGTGFDVRAEEDRPYGRKEQSLGVCDFLPGHPQDHTGIYQRGDGRGDVGCEGKGLLWPPPDVGPPMLQREEEGSRREFEKLRTGQPERGRGKRGRGFPENVASHLGSREGNWGRGGSNSEQMEYNTGRPREEERFSRGAGKRRVSQNRSSHLIVLLQ